MNDSTQAPVFKKLLSQAGVASRRAAEKLIADGRVSVNGKTILTMGVKVDPRRTTSGSTGAGSRAAHDFATSCSTSRPATSRRDPIHSGDGPFWICLQECASTSTRSGVSTTTREGLLLLTNDGELAARLTHPRHGVGARTKRASRACRIARRSRRLRTGIPLDGHRTLPAEVVLLNEGRRDRDGVLRLTIREGRNRQVRRMCEAVGHPVQHLRRTKFGSLADSRLKPGEWRELAPKEIRRSESGKCKGQSRLRSPLLSLRPSDCHFVRPPRAAASLRAASSP